MAVHVIELFPIGSIDPDDGRHVAETFSPLKVGLYLTIAPAELVAFIISVLCFLLLHGVVIIVILGSGTGPVHSLLFASDNTIDCPYAVKTPLASETDIKNKIPIKKDNAIRCTNRIIIIGIIK
jgi:hypothetical protein